MNKSLITNILSILLIIGGFFSPLYKETIMTVGFFAFSGAITNWLAVYMLFEKVPFLVGSGVIPNQFEAFKVAIKNLVMDQFFTEKQLDILITNLIPETPSTITPSFIETIDYDSIFNGLVQVILESKFGGMLGMFGGEAVLMPLKEPFQVKIKSMIKEMMADGSVDIHDIATQTLNPVRIRETVLKVVDDRVNELTPNLVKEIVQELIQKHLGWLVVWGGLFGGLIGLVMSLMM